MRVWAASLVGLLAMTPAVHAANAPVLRQVVLSTAGTGEFVFDAAVDGRASLPLDVPLDQVDDLLKSLAVDDPAGGRASASLPGREPLQQTFRTLPFGQDALVAPEALLGALVGEQVRIPSQGYAGTVLSVNEFEAKLPDNGGIVTRHRLSLATPTGLASVVLEDAGALDIVSDALRAQIGAALSAIAAARVQDRRTLTVDLGEGGARTVRLAYVVAAPVWKASYRLTLPAEGAPGPRLQGYAVVENLSGRDWHGVDVVLTSGQPVLYHQALYDPVFTSRPEAPVDVPNRLTPAVDAGTVAGMAAPAGAASVPQPPAPAPALMRSAAVAPPPPPAAVASGTAQVEFHLADKVDAASGQSLLLPVVDRSFPGRRVALFRFGETQLHPVVALLVRNDMAGALPPGLATLYEAAGAYVGDARVPAIQPGEERLLGFAADLPVTVDAVQTADSHIATVRAARGVLDVQRQDRSLTTYRITTPGGGGRTVLLEQPRRPGWTYAAPLDLPHADTPTDHRVTVDVPAGTTRTVQLVLTRDRGERIVVADATPAQLAGLASDGEVPQAVKDALAHAAALRGEQDRRAFTLDELRHRRGALTDDQDRVRKNLAAVPAGDLQRRYLSQLQAQEDQIGDLDRQIADAQKAVDDATSALRDDLANLTL